jgi:hypothetical protein
MASVAQLAKIGNTPIARSVGKNGHNKPIDVAMVQNLFNNYFAKTGSNQLFPVIGMDPDNDLPGAITDFQRTVMKMGRPDGKVDPNGRTIAALQSYSPADFRPAEFSPDNSSWNQDMEWLPLIYANQYRHLSSDSEAGLKALHRFMVFDPDLTDIRWAAYMFATIEWEAGHTFLPVEEDPASWGKHTGPTGYAREITVKDEAGHDHKNRYYGRGYVQLTWQDNYEKLGDRLGVGHDLEIDPEKVLEQNTAYKIASVGMREGLFRSSHKLSKYITGSACDYYSARNIINGNYDSASDIEKYAIGFECLLGLSAN